MAKTQRSGVAAGRPQDRAAERPLGHGGSSSSRMMEDLSHQASRQRRFELRRKLQRFARRDMVERTKWVKGFEVDGRAGTMGDTWGEDVTARERDWKYTGCGWARRGGFNHVGIRSSEGGRAGYSNLQTCGSVWGCPVCAGKIMRQRAEELGSALRWARREGHTVAMITLTVRHGQKDPLAQVWDAVSHGWGKVTAGSSWVSEKEDDYRDWLDRWSEQLELAREGKARYPRGGRTGVPRPRRVGDQERFGVLGWARAAEVKHGRNGWHVHLHVVVVLERSGNGAVATYNGEVAALQLGAAMFKRWNAALPAEHRASEKHGYQVSVHGAAEQRLAEYLSKDGLEHDKETVERSMDSKARSLAMEATHGASKTHMKSEHAGSTPFQILDRIDPGTQPDWQFRRDLAVWYEWLDGSEGRRQLTWSKGFRELVGLAAEEMEDAAIAAQEDGGEVVLTLPIETWEVVRAESHVLLEVLERDGLAALRRYLDRYQWWSTLTGEEMTGLTYGAPAADNVEAQQEWAL